MCGVSAIRQAFIDTSRLLGPSSVEPSQKTHRRQAVAGHLAEIHPMRDDRLRAA